MDWVRPVGHHGGGLGLRGRTPHAAPRRGSSNSDGFPTRPCRALRTERTAGELPSGERFSVRGPRARGRGERQEGFSKGSGGSRRTSPASTPIMPLRQCCRPRAPGPHAHGGRKREWSGEQKRETGPASPGSCGRLKAAAETEWKVDAGQSRTFAIGPESGAEWTEAGVTGESPGVSDCFERPGAQANRKARGVGAGGSERQQIRQRQGGQDRADPGARVDTRYPRRTRPCADQTAGQESRRKRDGGRCNGPSPRAIGTPREGLKGEGSSKNTLRIKSRGGGGGPGSWRPMSRNMRRGGSRVAPLHHAGRRRAQSGPRPGDLDIGLGRGPRGQAHWKRQRELRESTPGPLHSQEP